MSLDTASYRLSCLFRFLPPSLPANFVSTVIENKVRERLKDLGTSSLAAIGLMLGRNEKTMHSYRYELTLGC